MTPAWDLAKTFEQVKEHPAITSKHSLHGRIQLRSHVHLNCFFPQKVARVAMCTEYIFAVLLEVRNGNSAELVT